MDRCIDNTINDIINMLDQSINENCVHINITVNNENIEQKNIENNYNSECTGNLACNIPNLFEGIEN